MGHLDAQGAPPLPFSPKSALPLVLDLSGRLVVGVGGGPVSARRVRAFLDLYDAAMQLGILPRPGTVSEKALLALRGFGIRAGGRERFDR